MICLLFLHKKSVFTLSVAHTDIFFCASLVPKWQHLDVLSIFSKTTGFQLKLFILSTVFNFVYFFSANNLFSLSFLDWGEGCDVSFQSACLVLVICFVMRIQNISFSQKEISCLESWLGSIEKRLLSSLADFTC